METKSAARHSETALLVAPALLYKTGLMVPIAVVVMVVIGIMVRGIIRTALSRIRTAMTSAIVVRIMIGRIIRTAINRILAAMTPAIIVRIMIRQIIAATTASHHRAAAIE